MDKELIGSAANVGASVVGPLMGLALQGVNDKRQLRQQQKLTAQQIKAQKEMNLYNQQLGLDTWEKTNYSAQRKQMEKAGLNPGLMYGSAGQGGMTTAGPSSGVTGGYAPAGGHEVETGAQYGLQMASVQAGIELMKAQAKKAEAEANKTAGVDTTATETGIKKMIAETTNEQLKSRLIELESDINEIVKANKDYQLKAEIANTMENVNKLKLENAITTEAFNDIVKEIKERATGQVLTNELTKAKTNLTETEQRTMITGVVQKWTELKLHERSLNQTDTVNDIRKFEAEIKAEYPGAWDVIGSVLKKAYKGLENLESLITGQGVIKDTIK